MSFWTPVENPGTRPLRSRVFDVGCALLGALGSFGSYSFAQAARTSRACSPGSGRPGCCLLCCGLPVGRHCIAAQQIHSPGAPSRLGRALRERMPILSKTCPRWNSTALTVT